MHIPDGYLSPETCAAFGAAMVPVWITAARRVRKVVTSRYVPLLALGAAYCFLVMMFNVPIPDGTTAHAVGAVLDRGPARTVGRGRRGEHRARHPGVVLRRRRRARVRRELLQHGVRHADGRLRACTCLLARPLVTAPRPGGRSRPGSAATSGSTPPRCAPRSSSASSRRCSTPPTARRCTHRSISRRRSRRWRSRTCTVAGAVEFALTAGVIAYLQRANLPVLRINHPGVPDADADLARRRGRLALAMGR